MANPILHEGNQLNRVFLKRITSIFLLQITEECCNSNLKRIFLLNRFSRNDLPVGNDVIFFLWVQTVFVMAVPFPPFNIKIWHNVNLINCNFYLNICLIIKLLNPNCQMFWTIRFSGFWLSVVTFTFSPGVPDYPPTPHCYHSNTVNNQENSKFTSVYCRLLGWFVEN